MKTTRFESVTEASKAAKEGFNLDLAEYNFPRPMKLTYLLPDGSTVDLKWEACRTFEHRMAWTTKEHKVVTMQLIGMVSI